MSSSPRAPSLAMRIIESYREYIVLFVVLPISFVLRILRACDRWYNQPDAALHDAYCGAT